MELSKRQLTMWSNMTDNNEHSRVRLLIAKKFKCKTCIKEFSYIYQQHEKIGYMTQELSDRRFLASMILYTFIEDNYGIEMRLKIVRCL